MSLVTRQTMTDDSGTFVDGTVVDKDFVDQIYDQIDDQNHSSTNPTIKPKATTDEVVAARGSKASLDARLDIALNDDGTLKTQASLVSQTDAASFIGKRNLTKNDEFSIWTAGGAAAPDNFTLSGTGAAVTKCGSGESDTTSLDAGTYCAKITYGSATAKLTQAILSASEVSRWGRVKGKNVFVGIRAKSSIANHASIVADDGVTTTRGGLTGDGTYHSGSGNAEWIWCTHTLSNSATKLDVYCEVASAGAAYFGGLIVIFSDVALADWFPLSNQTNFPQGPPTVQIVPTITGKVPVVIAQGNAGTSGYGAFRTVNNAKKVVTIPAGTLAADGDMLVIDWQGAQAVAAFTGVGIAIGTNDYGTSSTNSNSSPMVGHAVLTRLSATTVALQGWGGCGGATNNDVLGMNGALTVSDLGTNSFDLTLGFSSSAVSGTDTKMWGYSVELRKV